MEIIEYRHLPLEALEVRLGGDAGPGTFEGYANRHGVIDSYMTRWKAGAWEAGGLDDKKYAFLDMHDPTQRIGWFYATEDETGLYIRGEYSKTQRGQDARIQAREGIASELSVGFVRTGVDPDDKDLITGSRLVEVSAITARMASQPGAEMAAVRKAAAVLESRETVLPSSDATAEDGIPTPEEAYAVDLTDDDLTAEPIPTSEKRTVTGSKADQLHDYWTHGKGLAKWLGKPKEWTALYHHLLKYIKDPAKAKATAAKWFHDVKNYWPGDKSNRAMGGRKNVDNIENRKADVEERIAIDPPAGSYELTQSLLREAITEWAKGQVVSGAEIYVSIQATFSDHVIVTVYEDYDNDTSFSFPYVLDNGGVTLGNQTEVELKTVVSPVTPDGTQRSSDIDPENPETPTDAPESSVEEPVVETPEPVEEHLDGVPGNGDETAEADDAQRMLKRKAAALRLASVKVA